METARLILRTWHDDDVGFLTRELANFKVTRNTGSIPHPYEKADAVAYIARLKLPVIGALHQAIILKRAPDKPIGGVGLYADPQLASCELGYWLAEAQWGQGYALEAATVMVSHASTVLNHDNIVAHYHNDNPASGRILQRLGFRESEQVEKFSKAQGKLVLAMRTCLSRTQWLAQRKL